ncbi:MAG TPA: tRNA epoxyqueuosine(34) reductase QueG [Gemmatimonadaceae bacterium]|nr:tRNA epoxyqueuosine(34) reductase QueG [Gemmatimonadaceae bacterium]
MIGADVERVAPELVKAQAYGLGFDLVGIAALGPMDTSPHFDTWIGRGFGGEMTYLARGAEKRRDSSVPYAGVTTAIVVGLDYGGAEPPGPVARYARGDDYHDVMAARLEELHRWLETTTAHPIHGKAYVDTGPILERDLARRAGLGWFGKNTNLVNPEIGSFFFIGALLVDLDILPDDPFDADRCGSCNRCLDACPTNAFIEPRVLDATKCISYLTIEAKGAIPVATREVIGDLLYGCDICQEVCPWNVRFSRPNHEDAFRPRALVSGDARTVARKILALDDDSFREELKGSPMKRAKKRGLARNAATVLGNVGTADDIDALQAAADGADALVAEHAAWAVERIRRQAGGASGRFD